MGPVVRTDRDIEKESPLSLSSQYLRRRFSSSEDALSRERNEFCSTTRKGAKVACR
jgi:hypothetical protein